MDFRVEHKERSTEPFSEYRYDIYCGDRLIAEYWHDHRGDEHGITFAEGRQEDWPVGRRSDFLQGGGPQPLTLSSEAVDYLKQRLQD